VPAPPVAADFVSSRFLNAESSTAFRKSVCEAPVTTGCRAPVASGSTNCFAQMMQPVEQKWVSVWRRAGGGVAAWARLTVVTVELSSLLLPLSCSAPMSTNPSESGAPRLATEFLPKTGQTSTSSSVAPFCTCRCGAAIQGAHVSIGKTQRAVGCNSLRATPPTHRC